MRRELLWRGSEAVTSTQETTDASDDDPPTTESERGVATNGTSNHAGQALSHGSSAVAGGPDEQSLATLIDQFEGMLDRASALAGQLDSALGRLERFEQSGALGALMVHDGIRAVELARDAAEATAEARLRVIQDQQRQIERYRRWRWWEWADRWTAPRIGQLYHYAPRPWLIPAQYSEFTLPHVVPSISIVTPSLNQGVFLERTLKSVLNQEYPALEYVVQDGGSKDGSTGILERYANSLAHVESIPDSGFANGINRGFGHTSGEIMAYVN